LRRAAGFFLALFPVRYGGFASTKERRENGLAHMSVGANPLDVVGC